MQFYEFTVRVPRPDHRFLRFGLRTALLLTLSCAMFLGGVMVGILYERKAIRTESPAAKKLIRDIDKLELQLIKVYDLYRNPAPEVKRLESAIAKKKAQLNELR